MTIKTKQAAADHAPADDVDDGGESVFVGALARGLTVLQCLAEAEADLTASEVARLLGLPQASVWRLCQTLLKLGFLERTSQERFRPGLSVLKLGHSAVVRRPLADLGRARMAEIAGRFGGAISIGARDDIDMVYLQRLEGGTPVFTGLRVGARVSILSSAMGWAHVASCTGTQRDELLKTLRSRSPSEYKRVQKPLAAALKAYTDSGFVINQGMLHPELNAIGVPIARPGAAAAACISFGGSRSHFSPRLLEQSVAPLLLDLAESLALPMSD